jgi:hypothetical protein
MGSDVYMVMGIGVGEWVSCTKLGKGNWSANW